MFGLKKSQIPGSDSLMGGIMYAIYRPPRASLTGKGMVMSLGFPGYGRVAQDVKMCASPGTRARVLHAAKNRVEIAWVSRVEIAKKQTAPMHCL